MSTRAVAERRERLAPLEDEYPFAPNSLDLGGVSMHYVDEGPRDAPPILFVHGNPTWSFYWRHPIRAFAGEYRCIAVDHVGCGLSDKPQDYPYRLEQHVANLTRLVEELDLRHVTLVVHDWGGPIGIGTALGDLARFERLVVLNTAAFLGGRAPWRIRVCRTPLLGSLAVRGLNAFARMATVMAVEKPGSMSGPVREGFLAPYDSYANRVATLRFVEDIPLDPSHPTWPVLERIEQGLPRLADVPTCLIWGERDWCFTPDYRREWERRLPHAEVHRAEDAGHYVVEDAREDVLRWMSAFFEANPLRAGS